VLTLADSARLEADEVGDWTFRLRGLQIGPTSFTIGIFHIDHADFTSPALPVDVYDATSVEEVTAASPGGLVLYAPEPSVVRTATRVRFRLARPSAVTLDVHDVQGRLVRRLVGDVRGPGEHAVEWPVDDIAPGHYILRLAGSGGEQTARVVIAR
jgi:hypothetical protein